MGDRPGRPRQDKQPRSASVDGWLLRDELVRKIEIEIADEHASEVLPEVKPAARCEQRLPEVADLRDALWNIRHCEIFNTDPALDLFPRHGGRDRRFGTRPNRVDR